ncbi:MULTISPECIES: hypothetical protein [unclassified Afipia]|uniref:hypothetical protein n=1 Tax=unclassified Afipia TaxID=2642050 RepID=UPI000558E07C|nr:MULTISPECIES: hypothetical protein [unclassified Afipia]
MTKPSDKKSEKVPVSPLFAFGIDDNGKSRGARFPQGLRDDIASAALDMKCRIVHDHSAAFTELGMRLPIGRVYSSGKAFIPNIRRDLYDKLEAAQKLPPDKKAGTNPVNAMLEKFEKGGTSKAAADTPAVACKSPVTSGLPRDWAGIEPGHMVLIHESVDDGWWEAVVLKREDEILTLRFRDFPKQPTFQRHINTVALVNPGPV